MNFGQAVGRALGQYAVFSGRARRSEYWYFVLFCAMAWVATGLLGDPWLLLLLILGLFLPTLAVTVRRLHDTGRAGWWCLIGLLTMVGFVVELVFLCQDSQPGPNRYGASRKYPTPYDTSAVMPPWQSVTGR